jgi:microcystin-dependent protein
MSFWKWSRTAANNATADASINWAEGQAPSTVNDSARAMMAAASKYRDDVAGAIATAGSASAYTLASFQVFDTLAHMDGAMIAFTAHAGNAGACTLNVDGLGAKPLRSAPSTELLAGMLVAGTPYAATYYNVSGEWILRALTGAPGIPLGVALPYFGVTAPASAFALPFGQAISRTTYANLFNLIATTYGAGDGSTTFNLPDLRGYLLAGKDDMGGAAASRITASSSGIDGTVLGAAGGAQTVTLITAQMPAHGHGVSDPTHAHGVSDPSHSHGVNDPTHTHNMNFSTGATTNGNIRCSGSSTTSAPAPTSGRRRPPRPASRSMPPSPASRSPPPQPASRSSRPAAAPRTRTCRPRASATSSCGFCRTCTQKSGSVSGSMSASLRKRPNCCAAAK